MKEMDIKFKTPNGYMQIYCDAMFPCDKRRFKKIIHLVMWDYESRDENIEILRNFFTDGIKTNDALIPDYVKTYFDKHQEWSDVERILADRKYPNGLPVRTDLEMKNLKERSKSCKMLWQTAENNATRCKRLKGRYEEHLQMLEGMI